MEKRDTLFVQITHAGDFAEKLEPVTNLIYIYI